MVNFRPIALSTRITVSNLGWASQSATNCQYHNERTAFYNAGVKAFILPKSQIGVDGISDSDVSEKRPDIEIKTKKHDK